MTRVDLITGFLGAGKTTFIHRYLEHLAGQRVLVIENEFGSVSVDAALLRDAACEIEDLSGVCMCCKGKGRFIEMLAAAGEAGYDRVLVEPSGIYDVDEFFSAMDAPAVRERCAIGSVLAIVDARVPDRISDESAYLMFSQLMAAGKVILSKTRLGAEGTTGDTVRWLNDLIAAHGGARRLGDGDVCIKLWDDLTDADFDGFMACGFHRDDHARRFANHEELYATSLVSGYFRDAAALERRLRELLSDDERFGHVLRAKGFLRDFQKNWHEINAARDAISVRPAPGVKRGVLVVVGQELQEDALQALFDAAI